VFGGWRETSSWWRRGGAAGTSPRPQVAGGVEGAELPTCGAGGEGEEVAEETTTGAPDARLKKMSQSHAPANARPVAY
jgi:hypothetical protein